MQEPIEFGTDGIRGIAGEYPLAPETVLAVGRAIGAWLRKTSGDPTVLIGRDTRPSGQQLTHTLLAGLAAEGVTADDVGVITTPGVAHLTRALGYDMGIVISASHNPFDQNGIKLIGADGFKLDDDDEEAIEALIVRKLTGGQPPDRFGEINQAEQHRDRYLKHLIGGLEPGALKGLRVVLDCANGAAFDIAPRAFAHLGATVTALGTSPTGHNINVRTGSEHVRRHSNTLLAMMEDSDAHMGIAFDGDADRVIFMTASGKLTDGDHTMALLATHLQQQNTLTGSTVVTTTMSNSGLEYYLKQHGISMERTRVGDRYVLARMRAGGFTLGGEQAGHIIVLDGEHTTGDGIHIGLQVAGLMARDHNLLEGIVADMPKFPQVIASAHLDRRAPLEEIPTLKPLVEDALRSFDHQGRVDMRYSGTEPNLMRAMVEGGLKSSMEEVIKRALALCDVVADASETDAPHIDIVDCATGARIDLDTYQ